MINTMGADNKNTYCREGTFISNGVKKQSYQQVPQQYLWNMWPTFTINSLSLGDAIWIASGWLVASFCVNTALMNVDLLPILLSVIHFNEIVLNPHIYIWWKNALENVVFETTGIFQDPAC